MKYNYKTWEHVGIPQPFQFLAKTWEDGIYKNETMSTDQLLEYLHKNEGLLRGLEVINDYSHELFDNYPGGLRGSFCEWYYKWDKKENKDKFTIRLSSNITPLIKEV